MSHSFGEYVAPRSLGRMTGVFQIASHQRSVDPPPNNRIGRRCPPLSESIHGASRYTISRWLQALHENSDRQLLLPQVLRRGLSATVPANPKYDFGRLPAPR